MANTMKNVRTFNEIVDELRNHPDYVSDLIFDVNEIILHTASIDEDEDGYDEIREYIITNKARIGNNVLSVLTNDFEYGSPLEECDNELSSFIKKTLS